MMLQELGWHNPPGERLGANIPQGERIVPELEALLDCSAFLCHRRRLGAGRTV